LENSKDLDEEDGEAGAESRSGLKGESFQEQFNFIDSEIKKNAQNNPKQPPSSTH